MCTSWFTPPLSQARKKSTKINFLGPETARWGGGLPLEGVVAENFVPALESLSSLGFEERNLGCPGNFARMSWTPGGVQKFAQKNFVCIFRSLLREGRCENLHKPPRGALVMKTKFANQSAWERGPKTGNARKWSGEGATGLSDPGAKASALSETCFAPVQSQVAPVQEDFRSLAPKDLLHPLLTTFIGDRQSS